MGQALIVNMRRRAKLLQVAIMGRMAL